MRISVIVANYNYAHFIGAAIHSLINQSMPKSEYEIIVVDDGSTDNSLKVLSQYQDLIKIVPLSHKGLKRTCNEGFRLSMGQYIVRVDSDDYVNTDFLKMESLLLEENKDFDAVSCDYYKVDILGNRLSRFYALQEPIASGVMFRREKLFETGLYEDNTNIWEDTQFVERFIKKYKTFNIPLPLYRYRQHSESLTHKEREK